MALELGAGLLGPLWLPWLSRWWRKAREETTWARGRGGLPDHHRSIPLPLPLQDGSASHRPPSFGPLGKLMEPAFPSWGALSKCLTAGRLQGGTWVGWTLAEPQETKKRRGEGSWRPVSPQLSSTPSHPSPPSQLHFNPEGEWGPGDRAGGHPHLPVSALLSPGRLSAPLASCLGRPGPPFPWLFRQELPELVTSRLFP